MSINFKHEKDKELFLKLKPVLISLVYSHILPVFKRKINGYTITITRTIDEKIPGKSVSNTHAEGRAIDVRSNDIRPNIAKEIEIELNLLLADKFGAISLSGRQPIFAVLESDHFHFQIKPDINETLIMELVSKGGLHGK